MDNLALVIAWLWEGTTTVYILIVWFLIILYLFTWFQRLVQISTGFSDGQF